MVTGLLAACGQKGPLYLPDTAKEVVTRPASAPPDRPESESTSVPNSPHTADSPAATPSPAPEVTAPEGTSDATGSKKEKGAAPPPQ